jgi:hypothetical protein
VPRSAPALFFSRRLCTNRAPSSACSPSSPLWPPLGRKIQPSWSLLLHYRPWAAQAARQLGHRRCPSTPCRLRGRERLVRPDSHLPQRQRESAKVRLSSNLGASESFRVSLTLASLRSGRLPRPYSLEQHAARRVAPARSHSTCRCKQALRCLQSPAPPRCALKSHGQARHRARHPPHPRSATYGRPARTRNPPHARHRRAGSNVP